MKNCTDGDGGHTGREILTETTGDIVACSNAMVSWLKKSQGLVSWADVENNTRKENLDLASNCLFECTGILVACCQNGFVSSTDNSCKF